MDQSAGFRIAEHIGSSRTETERKLTQISCKLETRFETGKYLYKTLIPHIHTTQKYNIFILQKKFKSAKKKLAFAYYTTLKAVEEIEIMKQK